MRNTLPPLLSVIIPTHKRPQFLPRAIDSALQSAPDANAEVLVIPNGSDYSWQSIAQQYQNDKRVQWHPIETAHANAARNHGMKLAKGKYIRFLDDDDFLYPKEAIAQIASLEENEAFDLCAGNIDLVSTDGELLRCWRQPSTDDFVSAVLGPARATMIHAFLYKKSVLNKHTWDESLSVGQDTDWMIRLCLENPTLKWMKIDTSIGAWVQHQESRVSKGKDPGNDSLRHNAQLILRNIERLKKDKMLTEQRKLVAASALMNLMQKGLYYEKKYWVTIAKEAYNLSSEAKPPSKIYYFPIIKTINPLYIAFCLIPVRFIYKQWLKVSSKKGQF